MQKMSHSSRYLAQKKLEFELSKIPKKNKKKFSLEFFDLISRAQKDDYVS